MKDHLTALGILIGIIVAAFSVLAFIYFAAWWLILIAAAVSGLVFVYFAILNDVRTTRKYREMLREQEEAAQRLRESNNNIRARAADISTRLDKVEQKYRAKGIIK